jgi:hypothetical protein
LSIEITNIYVHSQWIKRVLSTPSKPLVHPHRECYVLSYVWGPFQSVGLIVIKYKEPEKGAHFICAFIEENQVELWKILVSDGLRKLFHVMGYVMHRNRFQRRK